MIKGKDYYRSAYRLSFDIFMQQRSDDQPVTFPDAEAKAGYYLETYNGDTRRAIEKAKRDARSIIAEEVRDKQAKVIEILKGL
jgi:hypothetical protein